VLADAIGKNLMDSGMVQMRADFMEALKWAGFKVRGEDGKMRLGTFTEWRNATANEKRAVHERFARGFEAYLMEGKAPTKRLEGVFEQFKNWLLDCYHSILGLHISLSPEIRSIYDRMLGGTGERLEAAPEPVGRPRDAVPQEQAAQREVTASAEPAPAADSAPPQRGILKQRHTEKLEAAYDAGEILEESRAKVQKAIDRGQYKMAQTWLEQARQEEQRHADIRKTLDRGEPLSEEQQKTALESERVIEAMDERLGAGIATSRELEQASKFMRQTARNYARDSEPYRFYMERSNTYQEAITGAGVREETTTTRVAPHSEGLAVGARKGTLADKAARDVNDRSISAKDKRPGEVAVSTPEENAELAKLIRDQNKDANLDKRGIVPQELQAIPVEKKPGAHDEEGWHEVPEEDHPAPDELNQSAAPVHLPVDEMSFDKAKKALDALTDKPLHNDATGIDARVNDAQTGKLLSGKSVLKSMSNGFTRMQHYAAAAHIEDLWKVATRNPGDPGTDKNKQANVLSIQRFSTRFTTPTGARIAHMLMKETIPSKKEGVQHRVYSVELESVEGAPEGTPWYIDARTGEAPASQQAVMRSAKGQTHGGDLDTPARTDRSAESSIAPEDDAYYQSSARAGSNWRDDPRNMTERWAADPKMPRMMGDALVWTDDYARSAFSKLATVLPATDSLIRKAERLGSSAASNFRKALRASSMVKTEHEAIVGEVLRKLDTAAPTTQRREALWNFIQEATLEQKAPKLYHWFPEGAKVDPEMEARYQRFAPQERAAIDAIFQHSNDTRTKLFDLANREIEDATAQRIGDIENALAAEKVKIQRDEGMNEQDRASALKEAERKAAREIREVKKQAEDARAPFNPSNQKLLLYVPMQRVGDHMVIGRSQELLDAQHELKQAQEALDAGNGDRAHIAELRKNIEDMEQNPEHYFVRAVDGAAKARGVEREIRGQYAHTESFAKSELSKFGNDRPFEAFAKIADAIPENEPGANTGFEVRLASPTAQGVALPW